MYTSWPTPCLRDGRPVWPRAEADDDRREAAAAQHHQTWEHLPAHAADTRSACGTAEPLQTGDTLGLVASRSSVPSATQRGHCSDRGEARSYSVGHETGRAHV